jgi:hypothetical protein
VGTAFIEIRLPNSAPVFGARTGNNDNAFNAAGFFARIDVVARATDSDGDRVTYSVTGLPDGASFSSGSDPNYARLLWDTLSAPRAVPGTYSVTVFATDSLGATSRTTIPLVVRDLVRVIPPSDGVSLSSGVDATIVVAGGVRSLGDFRSIGSTVTLTYSGAGRVMWEASTLPDGARIEVRVDGSLMSTVDCATTSDLPTPRNTPYTSGLLTPGRHTVELRCVRAGPATIEFDYLALTAAEATSK